MIRKASIVVGLVVATATLPGGTGYAGTEASPEVSDIAGDANFVNGNAAGPDVNISTAPASIDSADIRAYWLETTYEKVVLEIGGVRFIHYKPNALVLRLKTTAPAKPASGPSVIFRFPAIVGGGCSVFFELWVKGSAPGAVDRDYAGIERLSCGGSGSLTSGFSLTQNGNVMTATFPFDKTNGILADDRAIAPSTRAHSRVVAGANASYCCTVPVIDEAPLGTSFIIGSDVPPDVDCSKQPEHPECA